MKGLTLEQVKMLYPVVGVEHYRGALVVIRSSNPENFRRGQRRRGVVLMLSKRSLNRFLFLVKACPFRFQSLLTLTFGPNYPSDGKKAKGALNVALVAIRRRFPGVKYFWFLEFQERGAPHFHIGLTVKPSFGDRIWLAHLWARAIEEEWRYTPIRSFPSSEEHYGFLETDTRTAVFRQHRRVKVWENVRSENGAIRYVAKYVCKPHQKLVPRAYGNVGRFWGISRFDRPDPIYVGGASEDEVRELAGVLGRDVRGFDFLPKVIFLGD
jgi:hypothetical protein